MDKEDAAELMDAQEQISAGSLASRVEVVRTLLEAHQDAAAFGVISIPELGAASAVGDCIYSGSPQCGCNASSLD